MVFDFYTWAFAFAKIIDKKIQKEKINVTEGFIIAYTWVNYKERIGTIPFILALPAYQNSDTTGRHFRSAPSE